MTWRFSDDATPLERAHFSDQNATFALTGDEINDSKTNFTLRVELNGRFYYVKRYLKPGQHLRRFVGNSRVVREWRNLGWFEDNGIPTARRVVMGEGERRFGQYWAVIVCEEVPQTLDLEKVYEDKSELLANVSWRRAMINSLADIVARMHDKRFIHNDLNWRNLLVSLNAEPRIYVIDCPAGRPIYLIGNRRGVVRDLAFIDKMAANALSQTDRLRFYMRYRGTDRLRGRDKKEIRRILGFLRKK